MKQLKTAIAALIVGNHQQSEKLLKEYITVKSATILSKFQVPLQEGNNMHQYVNLFKGQFGSVVEPNSDIQFGEHVVKCVTEPGGGVDNFYIDGEIAEFYKIIEKDVDFSEIPVICFRTDGYRGVGCYFCIGSIDGEIVLIDTMDGSMSGR